MRLKTSQKEALDDFRDVVEVRDGTIVSRYR